MREPVCVKCRVSYRCQRNAVWYASCYEMPPHDPARLWCGDQWRCPSCHHEIIIGFGAPVDDHRDLFSSFLGSAQAGERLVIEDTVRQSAINRGKWDA
jgi:hypothetical protein